MQFTNPFLQIPIYSYLSNTYTFLLIERKDIHNSPLKLDPKFSPLVIIKHPQFMQFTNPFFQIPIHSYLPNIYTFLLIERKDIHNSPLKLDPKFSPLVIIKHPQFMQFTNPFLQIPIHSYLPILILS